MDERLPARPSGRVFGPVPSRRLGRSLGVDLVPFKTCTFDCVYCQLGRTTHLTAQRGEYVDPRAVLDEVELKLRAGAGPDFITVSGSGEPTLCRGLGRVIRGLKAVADVPVAVRTNGALLWREEVRRELLDADLVIPSLDAGDGETFRAVNRPCEEIDFDRFLDGLAAFRREFLGLVWLEVFLLAGMNATEEHVRGIAGCAAAVAPDKVQLNTVARPPAEDFARAVSGRRMAEFAKLFACPTEVIADHARVHTAPAATASREEVLALLRRRPCTVEDIARGLGMHRHEVQKHVGELLRRGEVCSRRTPPGVYYGVSA